MIFAKIPKILPWLLSDLYWKVPTQEQVLYLTFDDGPIPKVTPWVLDTLLEAQAKATFFCVGDNVRKHPDIYERILGEGHRVGNHTFNHLNGWRTNSYDYVQNVVECEVVMGQYNKVVQPQSWQAAAQNKPLNQVQLFRPPYGCLKWAQKRVLKSSYRIVMWDVLSGDFFTGLSPEHCLKNVLTSAEPGSIVVMHDSLKAEKNMSYVLPRVLDHFGNLGYRFEAIPNR